MILRAETAGDRAAVFDLVSSAFGQADEARLVQRLHEDGDAALSLVAEQDGHLVGHVLLSRMSAPFPSLALAPVSVAPSSQGAGVGSTLVREALEQAAQAGWRAVFVLGDPAWYERFGFRLDLARGFLSPYVGEHFMALALNGPLPAVSGELLHARAFSEL